MIDVGGGILFALFAFLILSAAVRVIRFGWGQWRCVAFGHRWVAAAHASDDGPFGRIYRTTGMLSWHARSLCERCGHYHLLEPELAPDHLIVARTYQGSRPR